jgi:hypothetical protein
MSEPPETTIKRRAEAERLIELARGMLDGNEEEMVAIYLDQAIETLHMLADGGLSKRP